MALPTIDLVPTAHRLLHHHHIHRALSLCRPDIFPEFERLETPLPKPLPGDPEVPDEEEEEEEEKKKKGPGEDPDEEGEEEQDPDKPAPSEE